MMNSWDARFMDIAEAISGWSKDRSRGVGAVIVSPNRDIQATGYNGFPRGIYDDDESRHERPAKYKWTEHAERNAIYAAARLGTSTNGSTMYVAKLFPCVECARAVIQSGIRLMVVYEPDMFDPQWGADFIMARNMLNEAGVEIRIFNGR